MEINIGKNIKYLREKKNIDQQTLADNLNVPRSTLACWENGIRTPKLEQIIKFAEYFNTDLSIIYKDLENDTPPTNHDKYKQILKDKGLMDNEENINEASLNKLMKIADIIKEIDKKE